MLDTLLQMWYYEKFTKYQQIYDNVVVYKVLTNDFPFAKLTQYTDQIRYRCDLFLIWALETFLQQIVSCSKCTAA